MSGEISTASPVHLNWVLERYQDYQPNTKIKSKSDRISIAESMRQHLKSEKERTGLGTINIMRHMPKPLRDGLTKKHYTILRIRNGKICEKRALKFCYRNISFDLE